MKEVLKMKVFFYYLVVIFLNITCLVKNFADFAFSSDLDVACIPFGFVVEAVKETWVEVVFSSSCFLRLLCFT